MSAIANVPRQVLEARTNIAAIREFIANTEDPQQVLGAKDRIKLAKEWAKIQKVSAEVHADLIRIEIECLRRIAALDALDVLGTHERSAAKFFASLDAEAVERVVAEFSHSSTAVGVFRAFEKSKRDDYRRWHGRSVAAGAEFSEADEHFAVTARYYAMNVRAALATIVEEFATHEGPFSLADFAEDLIDEVGMPTDMDPAMREGVAEVCRAALRKAPPVVIDGYTLPKFITCYDAETGVFLRVPASNARVCQLEQMVAIRREQLAQDAAALESLERVHKRIAQVASGGDQLIVDVLANTYLRNDPSLPLAGEIELATSA